MLGLKSIKGRENNPAGPFIFASLLILIGAIYAFYTIENKHKSQLSDEFHRVLFSTQQALQHWAEEQARFAQSIAGTEVVEEAAAEIVKIEAASTEALLRTEATQQLRAFFAPTLRNSLFQGFFVIGTDNRSLVSSRDQNTGTPNLLEQQPDVLQRAWSGATVLSRVQMSDVPIGRGNSVIKQNAVTMFMLTPIKNKTGEVIALLSLRLAPEQDFFPLISRQRLGETGETYVFDKSGVMLSVSRFQTALQRRNIVPVSGSAIAQLRLEVPHSAGRSTGKPVLTYMAQQATRGYLGENFEGYLNYVGDEVVGVWLWDEVLGIGLATEQHKEEAHGLLWSMQIAIVLSATLAIALLLLVALISSRSRKEVKEASNILQSIVGTASDGIVLIDSRGYIRNVNSAMERLFGYTADEMIDQKVEMLIPPGEHRANHDRYLRNYLETGEKKVIGKGREAEGMRKDGSTLQLLLTISPIELPDGTYFSGFLKDISELRKAQDSLAKTTEELALMALVAEKTDNAVIITDTEGKILWCNPGFSKITGYVFEEVQGRKPGEFLQGPDTDPAVVAQLRKAINNGHRLKTEVVNYHKSGEPYWVDIEIVPVSDEHGDVYRFMALERDITEEKVFQLSLEAAKKEAEAASRAKSTFLATMSHEIRTPLNGIVATMDLLRYQPSLTDEQQELVWTANNSAQTLVQIIDDILDFSKIEAGFIELESRPFRLRQVIEQAGDALRVLAEQKQVELLLYCEPEIATVLGDTTRLQQILFNLVGNAIKFSQSDTVKVGRVMLTVDAHEIDDGDRVEVVFQIRDNGIGMSADVQKRLFQPFVQGEDDTTRRFGGTGLGLVITERLVEMMEGRITIESKEGVGTTFTIAIPLKVYSAKPKTDSPDLKGLNVFIHSCDADIARITIGYLQTLDVRCYSDRDPEGISAFTTALNDADAWDTAVAIDCSNDAVRRQHIAAEVQKAAPDKELRFLLLLKGRGRFATRYSEDTLSLDINNMKYCTFINAIAALIGVESPLQDELQSDYFLEHPEAFGHHEANAACEILLVDDNLTNQKVISHQLSVLGFSPDIADDGQQGLDMWREKRHPLVLTDCHMPVMDGYQLAAAIRKEEGEAQGVAIIAITADALKGTREKCHKAGMDDYVTKPIQLSRLKQCIDQHLAMLENNGIIEQKSTEAESKASTDDIDENALATLLGSDDPELLKGFYMDFVRKGGEILSELLGLYERGELKDVGKLAHKLKSSSRMVGANKLADLCLIIEQAGAEENCAAVDQHIPALESAFNAFERWLSEQV